MIDTAPTTAQLRGEETLAPSAPKSGGARLADSLNPILVKELRQALRGRWFRVVFVLAVLALTLAAVGSILSMGDSIAAHEGRSYFMSIYVCLAIATCGLLPFSAYASMGAEWDENTFDLLILSNLRPRQILAGKLQAALVQVLLIFATVGPFLAFAFLLRGLDLFAALVIIGLTLGWSAVLCCTAISVATYSRARVGRIALMAIVSGGLALATVGAIAVAEQMLRNPEDLRQLEFWGIMAGPTAFLTLAAALLFCSGCNMLAHPEENRSTNVRVVFSAGFLLTLGWAWFMLSNFPQIGADAGIGIGVLAGLTVLSIFLVSEPEQLGRRVRSSVPRNRALAWIVAPWMPGGGRGVMYFLLHILVLTLVLLFARTELIGIGRDPFLENGATTYGIAVLYALFYLLLPSSLFAPYARSPFLRAGVRVSIPLLFILFMIGPAILGLMVGDRRLSAMEHVGNPFYLGSESWSTAGFALPGMGMILCMISALALAISVPRLVKGWAEINEASHENEQRALARAGRTEPSAEA